MLGQLQLRECLTQDPNAFPQEIGVPINFGFAQKLRQCHAQFLGHLVVPPHRYLDDLDENHTVAVFVYRPSCLLHTSGDITICNLILFRPRTK